MKCIKCEGDLLKGKIEIDDSLGSLLLHGRSFGSLYFTTKETKIKLIANSETMLALYCENCKTLYANRIEYPNFEQNSEETDETPATDDQQLDEIPTELITCKYCNCPNPNYATKCIVCGEMIES